jgi:hypothetical protein
LERQGVFSSPPSSASIPSWLATKKLEHEVHISPPSTVPKLVMRGALSPRLYTPLCCDVWDKEKSIV